MAVIRAGTLYAETLQMITRNATVERFSFPLFRILFSRIFPFFADLQCYDN